MILRLPPDQRRRFDELVRREVPGLRSVALRLCCNAAEADDLVQDTLEYALRRIDELRFETARAWLGTVLRHRFIDLCRRPEPLPPDPGLMESLPAPEPEEIPPWALIAVEEFRAAVSRLPPELGEVYRLHAIEECSYKAISQRLGVAPPTVGTRLLRARRFLKKLLLPIAARRTVKR